MHRLAIRQESLLSQMTTGMDGPSRTPAKTRINWYAFSPATRVTERHHALGALGLASMSPTEFFPKNSIA